jgi:quercetin dioxygenase-like cupin family protein
MDHSGIEDCGRRNFLRAVPAAAAAGLALTDAVLPCARVAAQEAPRAGGPSFQLFTAESIQRDCDALGAHPGNNNLVDDRTFTVVLTTEEQKRGKEFEWHEGRDHIFHILDGSTVYELGGTPKNARNTGPGEWLAPESEGATTDTLHKGDMLIIRRGTPHRRITSERVTFLLISPQGTVSA